MQKFASILDYPHPGLDPAVWGQDGKLLPEHRELIRNLLKSYLTNEGLVSPEQWVKLVKVVGSLTTYQYTFDTDFDIHIETDLPAFIRTNHPEMTEEQAHAYLDDFRKRINETTFLLPGTDHPLEIFFETPFVNPEGHTGSGMYDILSDSWKIPPVSIDKDFNIEEVKKTTIDAANEIAKELDISFGQVKQDIRRIEDLEHVANAWTGEQKQFYQNKIDERLQKLDTEIKSLIETRDKIVLDRRQYDPQGDAEVKFKYLQRFGYLFILSSLKEFLKDDGKVTQDELPEIKEIIQEASLEEKKLMIDFDDTIAKNSEDHEIESPLSGVKEALDQLKADGWKLVIYSCRANDEEGADEIRSFMKEHELPFDEVFVGKPHAEYYIDDKNIVFTSWKDVLNQVGTNKKEAKKKGNGYEYSAVLVNLPKAVCSEVIEWGKKNIPDDEIYEGEGEDADKYGREDKCHVTVLYGLHTNKIDDIVEHVNGVGDISLKFGKIGFFSKEDKPYDVVMVEIDSKDLHKLNKVLSDNLEFTNEFPKYEPHMTIAYVKKGEAKKYEGKTLVDGDITVEEVIFSPAKGKKEEVSLDKEAAGTHAPESTELSLEDGFIDPDGKFYPTEVHSHTSWAHTFFDTEYPELLEKGWIRVSVLPDELYFELRGINAKQMGVAEDLFYMHNTNPVVWDLGSKNTFEMTETDLIETGMSFFEYTTKRLRKKAAFMPSITQAPDNKWGPSDQVIPVDPNAVDAEDTWEGGEAADKPRDRSWLQQIIEWFKEPKQEKTAVVPTEQQIDQNTRVMPRSDGSGVIIYVDDLELVPDSLNSWLAKNVNHGDFVTIQDKHGNDITLRYPMKDIKRLIKFKLYQPEVYASMRKKASAARGWLAPNGEFFEFGQYNYTSWAGVTHADWAKTNSKMIKEKYGVDGLDVDDDPVGILVENGWVRISDDHHRLGVQVLYLKDIPSFVEDHLMSTMGADTPVTVEDMDGTWVEVEDWAGGLQKAVNKELQQKLMIDRQQQQPQQVASLNKKAHAEDDILQLIQSTGGATWNFSQGNLAGTKNYAISIYPDRSVILDHEPTSQEIHQYTEANSDLLGQPENSFGAWFDNGSGKYYLDVVVTIPDRNEAIELGRSHNQKAIFDLEKFEEIPTGGTGEVISTKAAWSHEDRAAWIAPDAKVFPVDYSHVDWYLANKKMLQEKYNFSLTDKEEQSDDPVNWMIQNGWVRLAFATRNSKEVGVQLADINSLPSWFEDTIWQFNPKILYLEDHNGNDVKLNEDQLHRGIEKSLSRYRKAASLSKRASFEGAAWVDPKGKVYRVPESHGTWISQNEDFLASQYGYKEFKDDSLVGVPELLLYGWTRVAVWSDGEGYIQVADLNAVPEGLQSFMDENYNWENGHPIIIDDLSDTHVEVDVTGNIQEDITNSLRLTKRRRAASLITAKSIEDVHGIPVLVNPTPTEVRGFWNKSREKQLRALIDPATGDVFVWDAYLAEHNTVIRFFDLNIDWEEDDGTYIRHVGHDTDIQQLFNEQSSVKQNTNSKAATPKHNTTWDEPRQDGEPFKSLPTTFEWSTNDENLNHRFPWKFMRRPNGPNYSNDSVVNEMLTDLPLSTRHANLQKISMSDFAAWIDPKGTVFTVRDTGHGGTHLGWIENNMDALRKEYNYEMPHNMSSRLYMELYEKLIQDGWIRIGDSLNRNVSISVQLKDLRNIPSYVDDYLSTFYEDGMKVEVEQGGTYTNQGQAVGLDNPFPTLQKAVNRALVSKLPLAANQKQAFSLFGFWVAPDGKAYDVRKSGSHTHGDWVMKNAPLLAKYGIVDAKKRDYFDVAAEMLNKGWARIGDTSRARGMVGVEVANIKNLPSYIDDTLATFMTDGQPLIVADLNDNYAEVVWPFKSLQSEVRRTFNRRGSLDKEAVKQQDVVDFYLMSLLPADELSGKNVDPEHYNAVSVFQAIVNDLREEYIKRGMFELKDEAETTQWVKAIPEGEMPEELKPYYTAHESGYSGNFSGDPDEDEDEDDDYPYSCDNCSEGLYEDDWYSFQDNGYCQSCWEEALHDALKKDGVYCTDDHKFIVPEWLKDEIPHDATIEALEDAKHEGHNLVNWDEGLSIDKEVKENDKKQMKFELSYPDMFIRTYKDKNTGKNMYYGKSGWVEDRNEAQLFTEEQKAQFKHDDEDGIMWIASSKGKKWNLKKLADGSSYHGDPWWEAPDDFSDYSAMDFYTIFKHAPWKRQYGGPLWAEVARTVHKMQQTSDLNQLIVLIDHFHDLGHNTGKLLDKFPEWHEWFKKLLDMKAQKNSLNYLLQRASNPVRKLVMDYIRVHKRHWRDEEVAPEMAAHMISREITKIAYGSAKNVLIICSGNTCRSPMAENLLRSIRPDLNIVSRGLYVPAGGGKMAPFVEQVLKEKNVPYGQHQATQVSKADVDQADIIFVMEEWQADELLYLVPSAEGKTYLIDDLDISDPIGGDLAEYQRLRDQLELALQRMSSLENMQFKQGNVYTDKEMDEIITDQNRDSQPPDVGPGIAFHDFPSNTTDYPRPKDTGRPKIFLDRLDETQTTLPSYEVSWFIGTPRGD